MSLYISKSQYCNAVQCPKMLWMKRYMPEAFDPSVMNEAILVQGSEVGDLAMGLFGNFVEVPYGKPAEMVEATKALMDANTPIIAEASFSHEGQFCSVDILLNMGDGIVEIYEVKSSTHVNEIYLHDTAYQTWVLRQLGYTVRRVCVVHINPNYVRHGALDLQQLFTIEDVTETAMALQADVAGRLAFLDKYLAEPEEPSQPIGPHCSAPYDCGFWSYCTRALPKPNIFDLNGIQKGTKFKHYEKGIISFADIETKGKVNANAMLQIRHELHDPGDEIDRPQIAAFLSTLSYPLYFLDFETYQTAVPPYDDTKPFQQIVFQYSLHYIECEGAGLKHKEYLAWPGQDPRREVAVRLCEDIPANVCVLAYNMSFEKTRISELAALYPDLSVHLMAIHDNIRDLMVPFQKKHYYSKRMAGSYSIKYVLPALFPDDPELDYHNLDGVHNGSEASATFCKMASMDPDELEQWRSHLLRYCGLDTYAMVKVWSKLVHTVSGDSSC